MSLARSLYRRLRRTIRLAAGRDIRFPVQVEVPVAAYGTEYGGWSICPTGITRDSIVYSVGIGTDISFDLALIDAYGVTVHAFDPTPKSIAWLETQSLPRQFSYQQLGVAAYDGPAQFFPPGNPEFVSHTMLARAESAAAPIEVQVRRVSTIMRELGHAHVDLLKMDIEGAEYDVIDDLLSSGVGVGQLLVEFHHRFPEAGIERTRKAVTRLNAAGYRIFWAADNGEEYGFVGPVPGSAPARAR